MEKAVVIACSLLVSTAVVVHATEPEISATAREIWTDQCRKCHGAEGDGNTVMGRKVGAYNFQDPTIQAKFTDAQAFKSIKEGKWDAEGKRRMRPAEDLSDKDIQKLIQLVRSFKKTNRVDVASGSAPAPQQKQQP
jgi:cytochrome c553